MKHPWKSQPYVSYLGINLLPCVGIPAEETAKLGSRAAVQKLQQTCLNFSHCDKKAPAKFVPENWVIKLQRSHWARDVMQLTKWWLSIQKTLDSISIVTWMVREVAMCAHNSSTWKVEEKNQGFRVILRYTVILGPACVTWDPVSTKKSNSFKKVYDFVLGHIYRYPESQDKQTSLHLAACRGTGTSVHEGLWRMSRWLGRLWRPRCRVFLGHWGYGSPMRIEDEKVPCRDVLQTFQRRQQK